MSVDGQMAEEDNPKHDDVDGMDDCDHFCDFSVTLNQALADWDHDQGNKEEVCQSGEPAWHKADKLIHGGRCDVALY